MIQSTLGDASARGATERALQGGGVVQPTRVKGETIVSNDVAFFVAFFVVVVVAQRFRRRTSGRSDR